MSTTGEMPKSEILRRSMRCFVLGWWSLLPVLGLIPALLAFADFRAVVLGLGRRWNAARLRLLLGVWLAGLGVLFSLGISTIVTLLILNHLSGG